MLNFNQIIHRMKLKHFFLLFMVFVALSCSNKQVNPVLRNTVDNYYEAFNTGNFNEMRQLVTDSIKLLEGSLLIAQGEKALYNFFQWDSVFDPSYTIIAYEELDSNHALATVEKSCKRIRFLIDKPFVTKVKIEFNKAKIDAVSTVDYIDVDFDAWEAKRNALTGYIDNKYPELSGFVFDQSKAGAENYLKAIEIYEATGK